MHCRRALAAGLLALGGLGCSASAQAERPTTAPHPRVILVSVNGGEWDILDQLLQRGELPNLASVIARGVSGKLRTVPAPNCPKTYSVLQTSTPPDENGIHSFQIQGTTVRTEMLKTEPVWSILSKRGVTVGMANVPVTFPALPVNGYIVSGMLTRGVGCESGVLCAPRLSEVRGGDAVYPLPLAAELIREVGDVRVDCVRMPSREQLRGNEKQGVEKFLDEVSSIRQQQAKLFEYLLTHHPTDFTFFVQSCEDRIGHWLYPIPPNNPNYDPRLHTVAPDAFARQYREFDRLLGGILRHANEATFLFVISDHGIKPTPEPGHPSPHPDPGSGTPVVARHDSEDPDQIPGFFVAMGPGVRKGVRMPGIAMSLFDLAPTFLHLYGVPIPSRMKGRVLSEIFESVEKQAPAKPGPAEPR